MIITSYSVKCLIYFISFLLLTLDIGPAIGLMHENFDYLKKHSTKHVLFAQGVEGHGTNGQTHSRSPLFTEVLFTSISGKIYLNPKYTGRIVSVTPLGTGTDSGSKSEVEFDQKKKVWPAVVVPESMSNIEGLSVTGEGGSLRISRSGGERTRNHNELTTITKPRIAIGQLSSTILFPEMDIIQPSEIEIAVFDFNDNKFLNGDIIALTKNQMAVKFENLPSTVISKEGKLRYSLKEQDGSFINSDMAAWGYEILIPDTDIGKTIPVKARIFGLSDQSKVRFTFQALEGQTFSSLVSALSVKEINSGDPITMISTSIGGSQLIRVSVEESL